MAVAGCGREVQEGEGIYVYIYIYIYIYTYVIGSVVQKKLIQHCIVIILQ